MNAGFEVLGQHVMWTDAIGSVFSLAVVWLAMKRTIWTWPVQLAGAVLLFVASISANLSGTALKQVLIVGIAIWGWQKWVRGIRDDHTLAVRQGTGKERLALIGLMVGGTLLVGGLFTIYPELSWSPWADAYIFVGTAVAYFAMGRALTDFWLIWIAVDLVGAPLAFYSGLYVMGVVYVVFFIMVVIGYRNWVRESRATAVQEVVA